MHAHFRQNLLYLCTVYIPRRWSCRGRNLKDGHLWQIIIYYWFAVCWIKHCRIQSSLVFYVQVSIGLLRGGGRILERIAFYGRTIDVWCIGRYFEGSDHALFQTVYPKFPREIWENHEKRSGLSEIQTGYSRIQLFSYLSLTYWPIFEQACTVFIVAPGILKIHWVLHTNKCTNCISYISLKLFTLKHFHCSYMFR